MHTHMVRFDPYGSNIETEINPSNKDEVDHFLKVLFEQDLRSPYFSTHVSKYINQGQNIIAKASEHSLVDERDYSQNTIRHTLSELNDILKPRRFRKNIFDKSKIEKVLNALSVCKDKLLRDNCNIQITRTNIWAAFNKLEDLKMNLKYIDMKLEIILTEYDDANQKMIKDNALFYIRQQHTDVLSQLAIIQQGYLGLDNIYKNNLLLLRAIEQAASGSIAALKISFDMKASHENNKKIDKQLKYISSQLVGYLSPD